MMNKDRVRYTGTFLNMKYGGTYTVDVYCMSGFVSAFTRLISLKSGRSTYKLIKIVNYKGEIVYIPNVDNHKLKNNI